MYGRRWLSLSSRAKAFTFQGRHRRFVGDSTFHTSLRGAPLLVGDTAEVVSPSASSTEFDATYCNYIPRWSEFKSRGVLAVSKPRQHRGCTSATVTELGRRACKGQCAGADGAVKEERAADGSIWCRGFVVSTATVAAGALLTYLSLSIDRAHPLGGGTAKPPAPRYRHHSLVSATSAVIDGTGEHEAVASMSSLPGTSHSRRIAATVESLRGAAQGVANTEAAKEATTLAVGELVQEQERERVEAKESASLPPRARALVDLDRVNPTLLETEGGRVEERTPSRFGNVKDFGAVVKSHGQIKPGLKQRCYIDDGVHRCHANVIFFGVSKCGTTSLANWMSKHPALRWITNIQFPDRVMGEAHIFDTSVEKWHEMIKSGREGEWGLPTMPEANTTDVVIDYTPHYSIVPEVPFRILERYGKTAFGGSTKYFVLLREPVARTISSWEYKFDLDSIGAKSTESYAEARPLVKVVNDGLQGVKQLLECRKRHPELAKKNPTNVAKMDLFRCHPQHFLEKSMYVAHVGKSMYALQLERWFTLMGRDNIKVYFLEEMAADPLGTLQSVFEFIGLDLLDERGEKGLSTREEWERVVTISHNQTQDKKKEILGKQVTPELVQELRDFFAPHNSQLEEILGRPLPESWSTSYRA